MLGLLTRFLLSALIDADRLNSAEREPNPMPWWPLLIEELEVYLANFTIRNEIDAIRADQQFPELGKTPVFSYCRAADFGGSALIGCGRLFAGARRETMFYLDEG